MITICTYQAVTLYSTFKHCLSSSTLLHIAHDYLQSPLCMTVSNTNSQLFFSSSNDHHQRSCCCHPILFLPFFPSKCSLAMETRAILSSKFSSVPSLPHFHSRLEFHFETIVIILNILIIIIIMIFPFFLARSLSKTH